MANVLIAPAPPTGEPGPWSVPPRLRALVLAAAVVALLPLAVATLLDPGSLHAVHAPMSQG